MHYSSLKKIDNEWWPPRSVSNFVHIIHKKQNHENLKSFKPNLRVHFSQLEMPQSRPNVNASGFLGSPTHIWSLLDSYRRPRLDPVRV